MKDEIGFEAVAWSRAPYLCEGDFAQAYYWLDDSIYVFKPIREWAISTPTIVKTKYSFVIFGINFYNRSEKIISVYQNILDYSNFTVYSIKMNTYVIEVDQIDNAHVFVCLIIMKYTSKFSDGHINRLQLFILYFFKITI